MDAREITRCTPSELRQFARGRLGLLVGPSVTTAANDFFGELSSAVAQAFGVAKQASYHETAEMAVTHGAEREQVAESIAAHVAQQRPSPGLNALAQIRWTAVCSGALDHFFEDRLQSEFGRRPTRRDVSVISNPSDVPAPRTLPVYKLLGSAQRRDFVVTTADFLMRSASWSDTIKAFLDAVKASPVLCLGFDDAPWLLDQILAHLFSPARRHLSKLILLADNPVAHSPRVIHIVPQRALVLAQGTLRDVAQAVEPSTQNLQTTLNFAGEPAGAPLDLSPFADLLAIVNARLEATIPIEERSRLLDYLFMPDSLTWDPFVHNLDFRRSLEVEAQTLLAAWSKAADSNRALTIHGRAASGKTTLLKRLAFNAASAGLLVGWLRNYWYPDADERLDAFFKLVSSVSPSAPVVLFFDDPRRAGELTVETILTAAQRRRVRIILVAGIRTSDYDQQDFANLSDVQRTLLELPDSLDDTEWSQLSSYLVTLGLAANEVEGTNQVQQATSHRLTRDTLALLYWLLPETRQVITRSVRDEFVRLGDSGPLRNILLGAVERSSAMLQEAYSMVAVSCRYGTSVPVEVLVNALGVDYADWLTAISEEGPAWGLLYPDDTSDVEGAAYRTRNTLVTDIVLDTINGGKLSHHGEVAVMKRLMATCGSTHPVYREYAIRVLVPHVNLKHLELADGTDLYDTALSALPFSERALIHHKGLFIRAHGGRLDDAITAYRRALACEPSASGGRTEPREFIHTSIAAAILDKIKHGEAKLEDVKLEALSELERSRSATFVNPNGVHVYARLVFELARQHDVSQIVDRTELVNKALAEIDHYIIGARSGALQRYAADQHIGMLEEQRAKILSTVADEETLVAQADALWKQFRSEAGFILANRAAFAKALSKAEAGSEFLKMFEYWRQCVEQVEKERSLSPELAELGLLLQYEWRIRRRSRLTKRVPTSPIDWDLARKCAATALTSGRLAELPLYAYLHGLALAHLGDWPAALRCFEENRKKSLPGDVLHVARDYLLDNTGFPLRMQGRVRTGATREFFQADDLRQEFLIDRGERWSRGEAVQHGFLVFAFAGPRAVRSEDLLASAHRDSR